MKRSIGLALVSIFFAGVLVFALMGEIRAGSVSMPQNSNRNITVQEDQMQPRRMRRYNRSHYRHYFRLNYRNYYRRHHRRPHRLMGGNGGSEV